MKIYKTLPFLLIVILAVSCGKMDTYGPEIKVEGNNPYRLSFGSTFTDPGATAYDEKDGDVSSLVVRSGEINAHAAGSYFITYNGEDKIGNKANEVKREVQVVLSAKDLIGYYATEVSIDGVKKDSLDVISANVSDATVFNTFNFLNMDSVEVRFVVSGTYGTELQLPAQTISYNAMQHVISGSGEIFPDAGGFKIVGTKTNGSASSSSFEVVYRRINL